MKSADQKRPLKVFLCHAHADRDAVRALYTRLTNDGVDAWLDKEKLLPGQDWELEIKKAVREADVVVVCLSKQFNQAGFRQQEVKWALDTAMKQPDDEIFLIPARLEECDSLESLRKWHWVDMFDEGGYDRLMLALSARAHKVNAIFQVEKSKSNNLKHLSALQEIDNVINSSGDLQYILLVILRNIMKQLDVDAAAILLLNSTRLTLEHTAMIGFLTENIKNISFKLGEGIAGKAALEHRNIQVENLANNYTGYSYKEAIELEKFVSYMAVPLISKEDVNGVLEIFQHSTLDFDDEKKSFLDVLASQAALAIDSIMLYENREKINIDLALAYDATIIGWVRALELRDHELVGHTERVVDLTVQLARKIGVSDNKLQDIKRGALLHDIGKMGVPDEILHKQSKLTSDEWDIMKRHPQNAYDLLLPIAYLRNSLDIPYCHHENWDGTGYPRGLKENEIPFAARIFAVVDAYDALATDRPYRSALKKDKILNYIQEQSGKRFDPQVVDAFIKMMK